MSGGKGPAPSRSYTCPDCSVSFSARGTPRNGRPGKLFPNGHWHRVDHLLHFERTGCLPTPRGQKAALALPDSIRRPSLDTLGVGERTDQLTIALRWMLTGYDNLMRVLPAGSPGRGLVDGSFGKVPQLARQVLGT